MTTKPIPDGYHSVTPYLMISDCAKAIDFYKKAFGATELVRMPMPDGKIGHAEIKIGDSPVMMADDCPQSPARNPKTIGGTSIGIALYVENSDAVFAKAVEAGASVDAPNAPARRKALARATARRAPTRGAQVDLH